MDDRRTWLLIGTIALVATIILAGLSWYLDSTGGSGSEPGEGMIRSGALLMREGI